MLNNKNLILTGFTCSGKTTIGKYIAQKMNLNFIDTDEIIEKFCKSKIINIFEKNGENYFRQIETKVCSKICNLNNYVIATGGGTLTYPNNLKLFFNKGFIIFIDTPFEICYQRIANSNNRPFKALPKDELHNLYTTRKKIYSKISNISISGNNLNFK